MYPLMIRFCETAAILPLGDQDFLVAIIEYASQFALFTAIAGLRSRTLYLLPPAARAPKCQGQ